MSLRAAAKEFGVPRERLRLRFHGIQPRSGHKATHTRLSPAQEDSIDLYIDRLERIGLAVRKDLLRDAANRVLSSTVGPDGTRNEPFDSQCFVGKNWISRFIKRKGYHIMKQKVPHVTEYRYFKKLHETIASYGINPADIWNMDETGFRIGIGRDQVVVTKSRRSQYFAISADGRYIPAFLILSGKVHLEQWYAIKELDGDTLIGVTETGFTNDQLNLAWIQHFDKHAKSKGAWRLLLLDGHGSHHILDLIEYAEAHNIVLFALPPHLTHLLQPLDVVVFQPYKHYHSRAVDFAIRSGASKITKLEFLAMIQSIRVKAFKESTILSAFKKTGIHPFNPKPILERLKERVRDQTPPTELPAEPYSSPFGTPHTVRKFESVGQRLLEFDPIDDIEKEVFVHNLQRYVKGAISQGHELKQTMVDLYNTKLAEQQRQGRKKYKNRHLQSGGVLTVDEGRAIAKSKEDIRIAKAEKLPGRLRKPKKKPNDQLYKLQKSKIGRLLRPVFNYLTQPGGPTLRGSVGRVVLQLAAPSSSASESWLGYVSSESALGRSGVPSSSVPQDFTPGDNFLQKQLDVMALASTIQLHALLPDSPPTSWSATFNVASDDTHFPCDSHARWIHLASSRHCRFALRTADPWPPSEAGVRAAVFFITFAGIISGLSAFPPGASGPHRLNGPRMAMQLWPLCLGYHDPHLASLWATWAGLTEEHLLFRCKKWMAEREIMLQCARTKIGNLSYFCEGQATRAVRAAIKFPIATGRLDREQGQQSSIKKFHTATDHASAAEDRMPNTWRKLGSIRTVPRNHRGQASKGMSPYQQVSGNMNAWPWPGLNAFLRLQILRQLLVEASGAEKPYSNNARPDRSCDMANDIAHIIGFSSHSGFLVYMASNGDKVFTISIKLPAIRRWHHILCGHLNDTDQKKCSHEEPCRLGVHPLSDHHRKLQEVLHHNFHDLRDKSSLLRYWYCRKLMGIPVFRSISAEMEISMHEAWQEESRRFVKLASCGASAVFMDGQEPSIRPKGRALLERAMEMILEEMEKPKELPSRPGESQVLGSACQFETHLAELSQLRVTLPAAALLPTNPNVERTNDTFCSELMVSSRPLDKLPSVPVHGDISLQQSDPYSHSPFPHFPQKLLGGIINASVASR
ncbi:DDE superfamily endonuclease [Hirsutella rhossiliensis]